MELGRGSELGKKEVHMTTAPPQGPTHTPRGAGIDLGLGVVALGRTTVLKPSSITTVPVAWITEPTLVFLLNEHAHSKKYFVIFQPARPFLLHKNEQGGHSCLIPCSFIRTCSFNRKTRVLANDIL